MKDAFASKCERQRNTNCSITRYLSRFIKILHAHLAWVTSQVNPQLLRTSLSVMSATAGWMWGLAHHTSKDENLWCDILPGGAWRQRIRGINIDALARGTKDQIACFCTFPFHPGLYTQPSVHNKCSTNCNRMTTTQAHSRSALWWYRSSALNSCSSALCNILQGAVVPLMGKGQTRLWKSLFTASCLAVWSRSQQPLKWNEPRSHRLILFFWMLAAVQWHRRERLKK